MEVLKGEAQLFCFHSAGLIICEL